MEHRRRECLHGGGSAYTVVGGSVVTKGPNVRPATGDEQRCMNGLSGYSIGGWNAYTVGEFSTDSVTISSGDLLWTSDSPYMINYDWISSPKSGIVLKQESKMGVYRVYAVDRKKGSHSLLSFGEFVARNAENAKMAAVAQLGCNASSEDLDGDLSNVTDFDRWHWHAEKVFEFDVLDGE